MSAGRLRRVAGRIAAASQRYQASPLSVARRMIALRARGIRLDEAYLSGTLDPRVPLDRCEDFVPRGKLVTVLRSFNGGARDLVDDKAIFALYAKGVGLPVPRTLALVAPPLVVDVSGRTLHAGAAFADWLREAPASFVIKPAVGMGGRNVDFYERHGDCVRVSGGTMTASALHRRICDEGFYGRALVQERLLSHASLASLSGSDALQCARVVTVVTRTGEVDLLFAFQKLVVGGHLIDNPFGNATGNLVVAVDAARGTLGTAFADGIPRSTHPETGATIRGFALPYWESVRALVERAAVLFRPLRAIGWDVALTEDGPLLVEGNTEWVAFAGERGFRYTTTDLANLQRLL